MPLSSVSLQPRDLVRMGMSIPVAGVRYPWLLIDRWGCLHKAQTIGGNVQYSRSNFGVPPYAVTVEVTASGLDCAPRMVKDYHEQVVLLFTRETAVGSGNFDGFEVVSDDDGLTWSDPDMAFSGGKWAAVSVGNWGEIVRMARVGTAITANVQWPGDTAPRANFTFRNAAGTALSIEDDTFYIVAAREGPGRWVGTWVITGESSTSDWLCADMDGDNPAHWERVT